MYSELILCKYNHLHLQSSWGIEQFYITLNLYGYQILQDVWSNAICTEALVSPETDKTIPHTSIVSANDMH